MKHLALPIIGLILMSFSVVTPKKNTKIVVIDVAHGGKDSGSNLESIMEKDVVLQIAQEINELNDNNKIKIILTRETDDFISLQDRVQLANSKQADLIISLHANYGEKKDIRGLEIYAKNNFLSEESMLLADVVKNKFPDNIPFKSIQTANFMLLKQSPCPAILVELGYLSNIDDRAVLTSEEGQWEIAEAIYKAIR